MHSVPEVHKPSDTCTAETERPEPILIAMRSCIAGKQAGAPARAAHCCAKFGMTDAAQELAEAFGIQAAAAAV